MNKVYLVFGVIVMSASTLFAAGENIARGKTYELSVAPNYSYCTEEGDVSDLTDGLRTTSKTDNFWTHKGCVGWAHVRKPIEITVDLGDVNPIAGVGFCSAAGSASVSWPSAIRISVSADGKAFYDVGDLVRLHEGPTPPSYGVYDVVKWATHKLKTKGRYVRFTVIPSGTFAFVDELEIYAGDAAWVEQPYESEPVAEDSVNMPDALAMTQRGTYMRIRRDIETVTAMDGLTQSDRTALSKFREELNQSQSPTQLQGFRAVVPINDLHVRLLQLRAKLLSRHGYSGITLWQTAPYDNLDVFHQPNEQGVDFSVSLMNGERRPVVFNVTNATQDVHQIDFSFENLDGYVRPHAVEFVDTREGRVVASALIPLDAKDGTYQCDVPSGMTRQIWIMVEPHGLPAGEHVGKLLINGKAHRFVMQIAPVTFPDKSDMMLTTWDYAINKTYGIVETNYDAACKFINEDKLLNTVWASPNSTPRPKSVDAEGNIGPVDFSDWDAYVKAFPGKDRYFIFVNYGRAKHFYSHPIGSETFTKALGQWAKAWGDHNRDVLKLKPKQAAILLIDEPGDAEWFERTLAFSKPFYDATDYLAVFNDPTGHALLEPHGMDLVDASDIVCPTRSHYDHAATQIKDRLMALPKEGKELWLYMCTGPTRMFNVAYFRLQPWHCRTIGATGSGFWALGDNGGAMSWNEYVASGRTSYTPLYLSDTTVHTSKHWEACREGVMDWQAMHMLEERIKHLKDKGVTAEVLTQAEQLLTDLPVQVINDVKTEYGEFYPSHGDNISSVPEAARLEVLQMLTQLAAMD